MAELVADDIDLPLLADPIWFFYLFWMPRLLPTRFDVRMDAIAHYSLPSA